jgi:serine/threonine protein kinase
MAKALVDVARDDCPSELGALKEFTPRHRLAEAQESALARLHNEIEILKLNRPGFVKLRDHNESESLIVTEYCENGTLEQNLAAYKGKPLTSLRALVPLLRTLSELHQKKVVHRDIKPQNIFVGSSRELLLGDFGLVFLPNQPERISVTGESVGPRDFMPPWIFLGEQPGPINPTFDVYMLGKVLWCMVSGKMKLHREDFHEPELDLTQLYPDDPDMYAINRLLDKCVVTKEKACLPSAGEMLRWVEALAQVIQNGGQMLAEGVPRPCRVCGTGNYTAELAIGNRPNPTSLLSLNRMSEDGVRAEACGGIRVTPFVCNRCGHVQFFKVA